MLPTVTVEENLYPWDGMACIATCRSNEGDRFIALMIDDDPMRHLLVKATERRIRAMRNNCISMREVFRFPEKGSYWYYCNDLYEGGPAVDLCRAVEPPPLHILPSCGVRLHYK